MKPVSKPLLGYLGFLALALSYLLTRLQIKKGLTPLIFDPLLAIVTLLGALMLLYFGWQVVRLKERKTTWIAPSQAPYILLVAQASTIWSALFIGYLLGQLIVLVEIRQAQAASGFIVDIVLLLVASLVLEIVALLVEHWCRIDFDQEANGQLPTPGEAAPSGLARSREDFPTVCPPSARQNTRNCEGGLR